MQPGSKTYNATIAGEKRTFSVDVPVGFNPETGMILFFFKGKGGASAAKLASIFAAGLKKHNCVAIYPQAVKRGKTPAQWAVTGPDVEKDYALYNYIEGLIPSPLKSNIMISGISNGGCFALWLTCAGEGTATCTFAASLWRGLDVEYPANVYAIHGKEDNSVPYYGGDTHGLDFLPAEESIKEFVMGAILDCEKALPGGSTLTSYLSLSGAQSQILSVDDAGHDVITSYKGIDIVNSMFEFFKKFV